MQLKIDDKIPESYLLKISATFPTFHFEDEDKKRSGALGIIKINRGNIERFSWFAVLITERVRDLHGKSGMKEQ